MERMSQPTQTTRKKMRRAQGDAGIGGAGGGFGIGGGIGARDMATLEDSSSSRSADVGEDVQRFRREFTRRYLENNEPREGWQRPERRSRPHEDADQRSPADLSTSQIHDASALDGSSVDLLQHRRKATIGERRSGDNTKGKTATTMGRRSTRSANARASNQQQKNSSMLKDTEELDEVYEEQRADGAADRKEIKQIKEQIFKKFRAERRTRFPSVVSRDSRPEKRTKWASQDGQAQSSSPSRPSAPSRRASGVADDGHHAKGQASSAAYFNLKHAYSSMKHSFTDKNRRKQQEPKSKGLKRTMTEMYVSRRTRDFDDHNSEDHDHADDIDEFNQQLRRPNKDVASSIHYRDTQGNQIIRKPNERFHNYTGLFNNLLTQHSVATLYPIVSMIINYRSTRALTISKKDDTESWVMMFDLDTTRQTFMERYGGHQDSFVKLKDVEQNNAGDKYACAYIDDGSFKMRVFTDEQRSREQAEAEEVCFNTLLGLDNHTMPCDDFQDPFITCCFITNDLLFVNFFYTKERAHFHFVWDHERREMHGPVKVKMGDICSSKNFPIKCFYNFEKNEIYSFYRQGQAFSVMPETLDYRIEQITFREIGQLVLYNNAILVARSSGKILFFKQQQEDKFSDVRWVQYHELQNCPGFLFFIKGNSRFQITTDQRIYFYLVDKKTLVPVLENVMNNYIKCNQLMLGSKARYCIGYKTNQRCFEIFKRKYTHNFRVTVSNESFEGSKCLELLKTNTFLITKIDKIVMYDSDTFQVCGETPIKLMEATGREPNEIIGIQKSEDENWLAVVSGKNLIMDEQSQNQLFIFKRKRSKKEGHYDTFVQYKRIVVREMPLFNKVTMTFYFKNLRTDVTSDSDGQQVGQQQPDSLIFVKQDLIFELNYETEEVQIVYKFQEKLKKQPDFFIMNTEQTKFVITSGSDCVWYDKETGREEDLDELYHIDLVKQLVYDVEEEVFFILCNKQDEQLGFYLIKFWQDDPKNFKNLTQWRHKLDIGDADIYILRGQDNTISGSYKELVIGFKTIYINTYTVVVQDLSGHEKDRAILFKHESFQLWESKVAGLIIQKNKDYISLSKDGMHVLSIASDPQKVLKSDRGQQLKCHSLDSLSFLKIDPHNLINFKCQDQNNRIVSVQQEWWKNNEDDREDAADQQKSEEPEEAGEVAGPSTASKRSTLLKNETFYDTVYNIKIEEPTLRELLILQSLYVCQSQSEVVDLIQLQPNPKLFFKTLLELDGTNMTSILASDSKSMAILLADQHKKHFSQMFPIIYKNQIPKRSGKGFYYLSALDISLKTNQVKAVHILVDYIVKYQNNVVSSFLFTRIMIALIEKGIPVHDVLASRIFLVEFDFDQWPSTHSVKQRLIRPYNMPLFKLRENYRAIFPEPQFNRTAPADGDEDQHNKVYKIKYTINLLPQIGEHFRQTYCGNQLSSSVLVHEDISLLESLSSSDQGECFHTESIQQLIDFKWQAYGRQHHLLGCVMHFIYCLTVMEYVFVTYIKGDQERTHSYAVLMGLFLFYPWLYDFTQLCFLGPRVYLQDGYNYIDIFYVYGGYVNIIVSVVYGPYLLFCKITIMAIVLIIISKSFFFLRIFPAFTPIVVMLNTVIYDLKIFLIFYIFLLLMYGQTLAVLGVGNLNREGLFQQRYGNHETADEPYPGEEYHGIGQVAGYLLWAMRISLGDYEIVEASQYLRGADDYIFWLLWLQLVILTCVIFLNIIVAEAIASYKKVTVTLHSVILKEKSELIDECEKMAFKRYKCAEKYPKFLIAREVEY